MILYSPVSIPFSNDLAAYTKKHMDQYNIRDVYIEDIPVPDEELESWNEWLESRGVSKILNMLSFKKRRFPDNHITTHIDFNPDGSIINNSVVIPVEGCKGTYQYWYQGKYTTEAASSGNGANYLKLKWADLPIQIGRVEIYDSPMLGRTSIPHNVYNPFNEYRTSCTIRFQANETFEYLAEKLSK